MKKTLLVLAILTILLYACKDEEIMNTPELTNTQAAQDHLFAEQTFNDVRRIVEGAFLSEGINKSYPEYTIFDADSSNSDTLKINFGPDYIIFPDPPNHAGKLRKGKIEITYTGKYRDSLAIMTTTFDNYYVEGYLVKGEQIITNQGRNSNGNMWFTIEVKDGIIGSINWNSEFVREWISGSSTYLDISDDQYKITGKASGNAANGDAFTMEITETLNVDLGCLPSCVIKSGKAKITSNDYAYDRMVNYGDSLCDCNFDVTINGNTYPIVVN